MYCGNCGNEITDSSVRFCKICGKPVIHCDIIDRDIHQHSKYVSLKPIIFVGIVMLIFVIVSGYVFYQRNAVVNEYNNIKTRIEKELHCSDAASMSFSEVSDEAIDTLLAEADKLIGSILLKREEKGELGTLIGKADDIKLLKQYYEEYPEYKNYQDVSAKLGEIIKNDPELSKNQEFKEMKALADYRVKYGDPQYIDMQGITVKELAEESGTELDVFLESYGLPEDMPACISASEAYYMIPVKNIAEIYNITFSELKELMGWGDDITEEMPWGEAQGETTVGNYVGEENISSFKSKYGFGDDVTSSTKWKEIRDTVDRYDKEEQSNE